ncbi:MAG: hypothetical protein ABIR11_02390, partial [Candidatus Limnocylindrales bacterium]
GAGPGRPTSAGAAGPIPAAGTPGTAGSATRAGLAGLLAALGGALGYSLLGQLDLQLGFLVVAAFVGWVVGIAVVWGAGPSRIGRQPLVAAMLGGGAIVAGLLLAWLWAQREGGVLGPVDYMNQRYGPVAWIGGLLAAGIAAIRAR